jgi:hypothetical protein
MSIPFRIMLYVFMGSVAVNGGLKYDKKYYSKQKSGQSENMKSLKFNIMKCNQNGYFNICVLHL